MFIIITWPSSVHHIIFSYATLEGAMEKLDGFRQKTSYTLKGVSYPPDKPLTLAGVTEGFEKIGCYPVCFATLYPLLDGGEISI